MFSVTALVGPSGLAWGFMFKTREAAEREVSGMNPDYGKECVKLTDDFGQTASFKYAAIHAILLDDMEKSGIR